MNLGLSIGMSQNLRQGPYLKQDLPYESSGDLELLSLHKIKNRINTLQIHEIPKRHLIQALVEENKIYREMIEKNWYCLTPLGLDSSIDSTTKFLERSNEAGITTIPNPRERAATKIVLRRMLDEQVLKIKTWFSNNYDNLLYDQNGKIPWPIVQRMRNEFGRWALGEVSAFQIPIEDLISETAIENGIDPEDYESTQEIWDELKK